MTERKRNVIFFYFFYEEKRKTHARLLNSVPKMGNINWEFCLLFRLLNSKKGKQTQTERWPMVTDGEMDERKMEIQNILRNKKPKMTILDLPRRSTAQIWLYAIMTQLNPAIAHFMRLTKIMLYKQTIM